jgi:HlyD family secretion protein
MAMTWAKRLSLLAALAAIVALFTWLLWPEPVLVEVTEAKVGPMELTVEEEGVNRIREVYVVSSPVTGKVQRSPLKVGDHVVKGKTAVALIRPADPAMLDVRTQRELEAALQAAKAARDAAVTGVSQAQKELAFAESELKRASYLAERKIIAESLLEKRQLEEDAARQQLETARATLDMRQHDVELAEARLNTPAMIEMEGGDDSCCISIPAPVNGTVLRIPVESEQTVQAGTALVEIGNPLDSEIAVDLLSTDAVNVRRGARARITGWGGDTVLDARVIRIEPAAFTKISALGIEEQRVKTILELTDPPARWSGLGHEYRVIAAIVTWHSDNALQVPVSALFRQQANWAVFRVTDGEARLTPVKIGHIGNGTAEVLDGLAAGTTVITHPSDQIEDGAKVVVRSADES